jgi:glycine oxidase
LATDWWDEAVRGLVQRRGTLVLASPRDLADLKRFATRTRGHRWVGEEEIGEIEPDLKGRFGTGLFFSEEAHLDPRHALRGLYQAARQLGVSFRFEEEAGDAGGYASVIDCRGPQAIGEIEGLRGVRGEMLYLETSDVTLSRPVRLLHPRHPLYIVPRGNGRFMLGATMIEAEDDGPITARSMMELLNTAYALHPAFAEARIVETGTGIRPAFPDNVPRLIETSEGLAVAGMHRHGFLLAPALAREAADRLTTTHASERRRTA